MNNISSFVKFQRKKRGMTQEELASKAGVGIRFIRDLEQGKTSLQMDKVNVVLSLFGYSLIPDKMQISAYDILFDFFNKAIKITLKDKKVKYGIILEEIINPIDNKISAWKFVSNGQAREYQQTKDDTLTETIQHTDIQDIQMQE